MDAQEFAQDIVDTIKGLTPAQKEEIADGLSRYFWASQRAQATQDVKNQTAPRILVSGNEVNKDGSGKQVGFGNTGHSQFPVINFVGATGSIDSSTNGVQVNVTTGGGGADCMFDFLVSSCFSSLAGFTEGQVFTSLSGCTYKGYSTWQGVMTYLDANSTNGGAYTIYLCGITSESVTFTYPASKWGKIAVFGNGARHSGITGTISLSGTEGTSHDVRFYDLGATTLSASSGNAHHPKCYRCNFTTVSATTGTGYDGLVLDECVVTNVDGSGGGEWNNTVVEESIISGNIDLSGNASASDCLISNNRFTTTGSCIKILASSSANGNVIADNVWQTSGGNQTVSQIQITGSSPMFGLKIEGNSFRAPATTSVPTISITATDYTEVAIVGNSFSYAAQLVPFISGASGSKICATIIGNNFQARNDTPTYIETDGGVSVQGTFINSSIGLNTPASFALTLLTGSSGNIYNGTGTITGSGATNIYALAGSSYVTMSSDSNLSAERVATAGNGISITDGGANTTATFALGNLTSNWTQGGAFDINSSGKLKGTSVQASGLTGATSATRYVGATTSGAPASGTFAVGDFVITQDAHIFVCTVAGSPGTWVDAGSYGTGGSGASTADSFVTINHDADLTGERTLAVDASMSLTDGGANASVTLGVAAATKSSQMTWYSGYPSTNDAVPYQPVQFDGGSATAVAFKLRAEDYGYGTMTVDLQRATNTLPNPSFGTLLTSDLTVEAAHMCYAGMEDVHITNGAINTSALANDDIIRVNYDSTAGGWGVTAELTVTVP